MADKTGIEWADSTWTPIRARYLEIQDDGSGRERVGWHCEHVSDGCRFCYAEVMNRRLGTGLDFKPGNLFRSERVGYVNGEAKIFLDETMLTQPLRWRRPRRIFVCSMTDLFADFVSDEMIDRVFAVMALAPQHTFMVLTKRAERMRRHLLRQEFGREVEIFNWPLPNVWLGVSVEDQARADERIPLLLQTPAAVRFLSCEPLLGPIDLYGRHAWWATNPANTREEADFIDWVIVGGESGPGARPFDLRWARDLVRQCRAAEVACFVKQIGAKPVLDGYAESVMPMRDRKGGDWSEWPEDLRVREFPR